MWSKTKKHLVMKKNKTEIDFIPIFIILLIAVYLFIAIFAFYSFFSYKEIKPTDITQVNGTIEEYYITGGKTESLIIKLREYGEKFYISSVEFQSFNYKGFKENELVGNSIYLYISKDDYRKLLNKTNFHNKELLVYGVSTVKQEYLNIGEFNKYERADTRIALLIGCVLTLIPTIIIIFFIRIMVKN